MRNPSVHSIPALKNWCFDWDGTLIDQKMRYTLIHRILVAAMGGKAVANYWKLRRSGLSEAQIVIESGVEASRIRTYDYLREEALEDPTLLRLDRLFPGTLELLGHLHQLNCTTWIVSHRSNMANLGDQIRFLGVDTVVDGWTCTNARREVEEQDVMALSPEAQEHASLSKAGFLIQMGALSETVLVGDSPSDVRAAKLAGAYSIGIPSGLYGPHSLRQAGVNLLVKSIQALFGILLKQVTIQAGTQADTPGGQKGVPRKAECNACSTG